MSEADYTRTTYVSGAGTDSSEQGRIRWARIKGRTENALLAKPVPAYMFRPGIIQAMHGAVSKTPLHRNIYRFLNPLLSLLRGAFPRLVTTTERIGRAMLNVAIDGWPEHILDNAETGKAAAGR